MNQRILRASLVFLVGWCSPQRGLGQAAAKNDDAVSSESVVELNLGILAYLRGQQGLDSPNRREEALRQLDRAVELFASVLERQPNSPEALVFRALAHGQIGQLHRYYAFGPAQQDKIDLDDVIKLRSDPDAMPRLEAEIAEHTSSLQVGTFPPGDEIYVSTQLARAKRLSQALEESVGKTDADLSAELWDAKQRIFRANSDERTSNLAMTRDLKAAIGLLDEPPVVLRLLDVVANAKIARADEAEVLAIAQKEDVPDPISPVGLRPDIARRLRGIAVELEGILESIPPSEDSHRARFFLGVIRFRQGVPLRAAGEAQDIDKWSLGQAEREMRTLLDDPDAPRHWRSYSALYLGMIIPFEVQGLRDPVSRGAVLDEAEYFLQRALELDETRPEDADGDVRIPARSESAGGIPGLVRRQRDDVIAVLARSTGAVAAERNDLQFGLFVGAHRDTNVELLGDNTALPRDLSRDEDFGFSLAHTIDYTVDLTDRLTLGLQGRTSQLWHADVDEFDQQVYGGSAALQYELYSETGDLGPVYLELQYDYDYTLLGRTAFLDSHKLRPNIRIFWLRRRAETNVYYEYDVRDYHEALFDRRFNRDGSYHVLGVSQAFKLIDMAKVYSDRGIEPWGLASDATMGQHLPDYPKRYLRVAIGLEYAWDSTDGDEFDRNALKLLGVLQVPLPWGVLFDILAVFEWEDYRHGSLVDFHRQRRSDFIQEYEIALSRMFVLKGGDPANRYTPIVDRLWMEVRAFGRWTDDDSNVVDRPGQAVFSYDRWFYGVSLGWVFN